MAVLHEADPLGSIVVLLDPRRDRSPRHATRSSGWVHSRDYARCGRSRAGDDRPGESDAHSATRSRKRRGRDRWPGSIKSPRGSAARQRSLRLPDRRRVQATRIRADRRPGPDVASRRPGSTTSATSTRSRPRPTRTGGGSDTTRQLLLRNASGKLIEDPGWPGEIILNTSTAADRQALATIENGWLKGCKAKGFKAVEPDNLDSNTRSQGLLTQADDFAFAKLLVDDAHADGLAIAQKNDAEQARTCARRFTSTSRSPRSARSTASAATTSRRTATRSSRSSTPTTAEPPTRRPARNEAPRSRSSCATATSCREAPRATSTRPADRYSGSARSAGWPSRACRGGSGCARSR